MCIESITADMIGTFGYQSRKSNTLDENFGFTTKQEAIENSMGWSDGWTSTIVEVVEGQMYKGQIQFDLEFWELQPTRKSRVMCCRDDITEDMIGTFGYQSRKSNTLDENFGFTTIKEAIENSMGWSDGWTTTIVEVVEGCDLDLYSLQ